MKAIYNTTGEIVNIEDSRLEITYRDSVAIDSTVVYK